MANGRQISRTIYNDDRLAYSLVKIFQVQTIEILNRSNVSGRYFRSRSQSSPFCRIKIIVEMGEVRRSDRRKDQKWKRLKVSRTKSKERECAAIVHVVTRRRAARRQDDVGERKGIKEREKDERERERDGVGRSLNSRAAMRACACAAAAPSVVKVYFVCLRGGRERR